MDCERRALVGLERRDAGRGFLGSGRAPGDSAGAKLRAAAAGGIQRRSFGAAWQVCGAGQTGRRCAERTPSRAAEPESPFTASSMKVCAAKHCRHSLNACTWALLLAASKDVVVGMGPHGASAGRRGKLVKISSSPMKKMAVLNAPDDPVSCRARLPQPLSPPLETAARIGSDTLRCSPAKPKYAGAIPMDDGEHPRPANRVCLPAIRLS